MREVDKIKRGTVVRAIQNLDPEAANIQPGQLGVVFGDSNCYGDGAGPIVQWFMVEEGKVGFSGVCNVYDGWIEVVRPPDIRGRGEDISLPSVAALIAIKKLFHYSWNDIQHKYEGLTDTEKTLISERQFTEVLAWIGEKSLEELIDEHKRWLDGDRQDFLDQLDFVKDGLTSEVMSTNDLPDSCDRELFAKLVARDNEWKTRWHAFQAEHQKLKEKLKELTAKKATKKAAPKKAAKKPVKRKKR